MTFRYRQSAALLLLPLACGLVTLSCGSGSGGGGGSYGAGSASAEKATLVLDFVPGPVHAGIYEAVAQGYYEDEGIDLRIIEPTSTADTLKLIDAGKADFGIADGIDVATQIAAGRGAQAIMAIAQRPLGGVITRAESGFDAPADLEGERVGLTGVPSDEAVLDTMVEADGGDPDEVETVTIGFNGVASLEAGKIAGFTGFIAADGVQVETDGDPTTSFSPDEYGDLTYPGLVVFSTEDRISAEPDLMQGFVDATRHGYEDVIDDPQAGLRSLLDANPAIQESFAESSLEAYLPSFTSGGSRFGEFDRSDLRKLSDFMLANDLAAQPIDPSRFATDEFAAGTG